MKDLVNKVPKAPNANKIVLCHVIIMIALSCKVSKTQGGSPDNEYQLTLLRSKSGTTNIVLRSYDHENKTERIPASVSLNGVLFHSEFVDPIPSIRVDVFPNTYEIEIFFISKNSVKLDKLRVNVGDSILIDSFMKDSTDPVY